MNNNVSRNINKKNRFQLYQKNDKSYIMIISALICFIMPTVIMRFDGLMNEYHIDLHSILWRYIIGSYVCVPIFARMQVLINNTRNSVILSRALLIIYVIFTCIMVIYFITVMYFFINILPNGIKEFLEGLSNIG